MRFHENNMIKITDCNVTGWRSERCITWKLYELEDDHYACIYLSSTFLRWASDAEVFKMGQMQHSFLWIFHNNQNARISSEENNVCWSITHCHETWFKMILIWGTRCHTVQNMTYSATVCKCFDGFCLENHTYISLMKIRLHVLYSNIKYFLILWGLFTSCHHKLWGSTLHLSSWNKNVV